MYFSRFLPFFFKILRFYNVSLEITFLMPTHFFVIFESLSNFLYGFSLRTWELIPFPSARIFFCSVLETVFQLSFWFGLKKPSFS